MNGVRTGEPGSFSGQLSSLACGGASGTGSATVDGGFLAGAGFLAAEIPALVDGLAGGGAATCFGAAAGDAGLLVGGGGGAAPATGSGVMMLTGGMDAELGKSPDTGRPVGTLGGVEARRDPPAAPAIPAAGAALPQLGA